MKIIKWLQKKKIDPIHTVEGDVLSLEVKGKTLATEKITKTMKITEVRIFKAEVEGRNALGGLFMEDK